MIWLIAVLVFILLLMGIIAIFFRSEESNSRVKTPSQYTKKEFFMTRAEHEFYDALVKAVGNQYLIFAQVHLPSIVDNKVVGQNWNAAFRHINGKSVDFVLCDKQYIRPILAIELDDKTHQRSDRAERDREVERILQDVNLPLLRINNHGSFNPESIANQIGSRLRGA